MILNYRHKIQADIKCNAMVISTYTGDFILDLRLRLMLTLNHGNDNNVDVTVATLVILT